MRALLLASALLGCSCTQLVRYTDALTDERTGRTWFVRAPAHFGGVVGFVAGVPFDVLEFAVWRGWKGPEELTPENRERLERLIDDRQWDSYPVEPLYPLPSGRGAGGRTAGSAP